MKRFIYHLLAFILIVVGVFSCTKQDTRITHPKMEGPMAKDIRYSSPVTMTDLVFIQDDIDECRKSGVKVTGLDVMMCDDWRECEEMGDAWWVRDVCQGEGVTSVHLHDFSIRVHMADGSNEWVDEQKILFFPIHPGKYNEYRFTATEKVEIEIEIDPGFDGSW